MPDLTQENRLISVSVEGQADDALLLQSFSGSEGVSRPYLFQLEVLTVSKDIDFTQILGKKACITLKTLDDTKDRYFHGYVSQFTQADSVNSLNHYRMEVVPWIAFLGLNVDCRIFHNMTIPDIVKKILDSSPAAQKDTVDASNLQGTYTKLEYSVQYRESTLNFISRLMEHAGIFYYFTHEEDSHTMHLSDSSSLCAPLPMQETVSYVIKDSSEIHEESILTLHTRQGIKTGAQSHTDYNFKTPSADLTTKESTVVNVGQNDPLEVFDYPGGYTTADEGRKLSLIRMQEQEASHHLISGTGSVRSFLSGATFTLQQHPQSGTLNRNISYLITEVRHMATNGGGYLGGASGESYSNHFTCIPTTVPYRPPRISPKTLVHGLQTATVVGKSQDSDNSDDPDNPSSDGEEIWVDKYGRVMVLFPWDRAGACSCWTRVSQGWAGQGWGSITIPRVGQEVLVSFLDGDPDRPIITGRVYNATQVVPYPLPDNQTRSTFMTRSSKNGSASTYHELRFEDKTGNEQVFFRSQKDYDNYIVNDGREWIGNNRSLIVTKDQMESVGGDRHEQVTGKNIVKIGGDRQEQLGANETITISGNRNETVSGNHVETISGDLNSNISGNLNQKVGSTMSLQVGENLYEKSGSNYAHQAGQMIHLKAGMTVVIEAGTELCLKVGGNFIDINPSGVSIVGTMVMINSGGSAGSGCGSSPTDPTSPESPTDPTAPDKADDGSKGTKLN